MCIGKLCCFLLVNVAFVLYTCSLSEGKQLWYSLFSDVDECERQPCGNGTCKNTVGSYNCLCYPGFQNSHNSDCIGVCVCGGQLVERQASCTHVSCCLCIDQILTSAQRRGVCVETASAWTQWAPSSVCAMMDMSWVWMADCVQVRTSHCLLLVLMLKPCFTVCIPSFPDINECAVNPSTCGAGTCLNLVGSYRCICPPGFYLHEETCEGKAHLQFGQICTRKWITQDLPVSTTVLTHPHLRWWRCKQTTSAHCSFY